MAKWSNAPKEIVDLIASYGGVRTVDLVCHDGDVETLAQMLHANPDLAVSERLDNPMLRRLIMHYQPNILKLSPDPAAWWSHATPATPDQARWAMENGLDPNRRNWLGITMLHRCAAKAQIDVAQVCLEYGADINPIETEWSSTPLAWAAREGKREMVDWLLKKGANPYLPEDESWALPIEWAKRRGHREILEVLKRAEV